MNKNQCFQTFLIHILKIRSEQFLETVIKKKKNFPKFASNVDLEVVFAQFNKELVA